MDVRGEAQPQEGAPSAFGRWSAPPCSAKASVHAARGWSSHGGRPALARHLRGLAARHSRRRVGASREISVIRRVHERVKPPTALHPQRARSHGGHVREMKFPTRVTGLPRAHARDLVTQHAFHPPLGADDRRYRPDRVLARGRLHFLAAQRPGKIMKRMKPMERIDRQRLHS